MTQYPCPKCGKVLVLSRSDAGQVVLCNACGAAVRVPRSGPTPAAAAPAPMAKQVTPAPTETKRWRSPGAAWWALFAAAVLLAAGVPTAILLKRAPVAQPGRESNSANVRENADLLAIKSAAEQLAIEGKLSEAHARYRELQSLAATRDIKDPLLWDILERAKVDQDRVYTMVLDGLAARARSASTAPVATTKPSTALTAAEAQPPDMAAGRQAEAADPWADLKMPTPTTSATATTTTAPARQYAADVPVSHPTATRRTRIPIPLTRPAASAPVVVAPTDGAAITDEQIGAALQRGVNYLIAHYRNGQIILDAGGMGQMSQQWREGIHALCTYALLQASQSISDERLNIKGDFMKGALEKLKDGSMDTDLKGTWQPATYARGLRAAALSVYNRPEDHDALQEDAAWLVLAEVLGGYTYDDRFGQRSGRPEIPPPPPEQGPRSQGPRNWAGEVYADNGEIGTMRIPQSTRGKISDAPTNRRIPLEDVPWDNSNSQYGLMGVWSCAESAIEIPDWYWKDVEKHWTAFQLKSGEWGYKKTDNTGSLAMTAAGVASLFVTADWLDAGQLRGAVGRDPFSKSLAAGIKWLESGDNCMDVGGPKSHYRGYDLFSLERVGLASGFKHFGKHDWYRELGAITLARQYPDGSWGGYPAESDRLIETAYSVLFLARGRHPVIMSKLRFDGFWANRPRDLANLSRYAAKVLERGVNWQVVSAERDWTDWLDSPVLYLASHLPPKLAEGDYAKLRQFVEAGGLLFTHADAGSEAFNKWAAELARKLWPAYEMQVLPEDHEIYHIHAKVVPPHVKLSAVSNGSRLLMVHAPGDMANAWQQRAEKSQPQAFGLGMNLFVYASGKADLRNRLSSPYIPPIALAPAATVKVARLRYPGAWDPEPGAWVRMSRYLQQQTGVAADVADVEMAALKPADAKVAHLTGTAAYTPTPAELTALRAYVSAGGVLLVDSCGGGAAMTKSMEQGLLAKAFAEGKHEALSADDPIVKASAQGMVAIGKPVLRPYAALKVGQEMEKYAVQVIRYGKGIVIYSPLDLTSGMLGANTYGIAGYTPAYAQDFVRNLALWAAAR